MGKRRNRNKNNKIPLGAENLNVSSACDEVKEVPSSKVITSQLNQKKESDLQSPSCDKMPFVESSYAKPNSKVWTSQKSITEDSSGNSLYFPLNSSSCELKTEERSNSVFESERQARINCACSVRPKCKVQNTMSKSDSFYQTKNPSDKFSRDHSFERNDKCSTSAKDGFKQNFSNDYERRRNEQASNLGRLRMKESFVSKVNQYENCKASFLLTFRRWLPKRKNTLEELRSLYNEVHEGALKYNQSQAALKEFSYNSRALKQETDNQALDFFTSLTAFVSDAVSGLASFAEAFNVDSYQEKFQEIMDGDAEITKDLYTTRSRCIAQYHGVEEVMREFHSDTLASTVCKISTALEVDKHWDAMKNAYKRDDMQSLLNEINYFFNNASRADVLERVGGSVQRYVSDNPAALDACKSTGKALYGAFNTFREKDKRDSLMENAAYLTNRYLMLEDKQEVERLKSIISEDKYQNKLELRIESAIESLESELKEMIDLYYQLSKCHNDDSD